MAILAPDLTSPPADLTTVEPLVTSTTHQSHFLVHIHLSSIPNDVSLRSDFPSGSYGPGSFDSTPHGYCVEVSARVKYVGVAGATPYGSIPSEAHENGR